MLVVTAQQTGIDSTRSGGAAVKCKCGKSQKNGLQGSRQSADSVVETETAAEKVHSSRPTKKYTPTCRRRAGGGAAAGDNRLITSHLLD